MSEYGLELYDETGFKVFDNTMMACRLVPNFPVRLQSSTYISYLTTVTTTKFISIILPAYQEITNGAIWTAWDYAGYVSYAYVDDDQIVFESETNPSGWKATHTAPTIGSGTNLPDPYYDNTITGTTWDVNPQGSSSVFVFLMAIG